MILGGGWEVSSSKFQVQCSTSINVVPMKTGNRLLDVAMFVLVVVLFSLHVQHRPAHDDRGRLGGELWAGALYTRNPVNGFTVLVLCGWPDIAKFNCIQYMFLHVNPRAFDVGWFTTATLLFTCHGSVLPQCGNLLMICYDQDYSDEG